MIKYRAHINASQNLIQTMRFHIALDMTYFEKHFPDTKIFVEPDVSFSQSALADEHFNHVYNAQFTEENAHKRVSEILAKFQEKNLPCDWLVGDFDTPSNLAEVLLSKGFHFNQDYTGMYLPLEELALSEKDSPLRFERVSTYEQLNKFLKHALAVFDLPESFLKRWQTLPLSAFAEDGPAELYLAYVDDTVCVSGIVLIHDDIVGISYLGTALEHRKKGLGTCMMQHLLLRAKEKGCHLALLQAASEGLSLYKRLGFKECCSFLEYAHH